jgi:type II secretory pathway pseudopilin PulG
MRPLHGVLLAVAVLSTLAVAGFYGYAYWRDQQKAAQRAGSFDFAGAACEQLTQAEFTARRLKIRNKFVYEGVEFGRAAGHADCAALKDGPLGLRTTPACQFTSPAALSARTEAGERLWVVGVGQPATVFIQDGEPRCAKGANFTMESLVGG